MFVKQTKKTKRVQTKAFDIPGTKNETRSLSKSKGGGEWKGWRVGYKVEGEGYNIRVDVFYSVFDGRSTNGRYEHVNVVFQ